MTDKKLTYLFITIMCGCCALVFFAAQAGSKFKEECNQKGGIVISTEDKNICVKKDSIL